MTSSSFRRCDASARARRSVPEVVFVEEGRFLQALGPTPFFAVKEFVPVLQGAGQGVPAVPGPVPLFQGFVFGLAAEVPGLFRLGDGLDKGVFFLVGVAVLEEVFPFLLQKAMLLPPELQVGILTLQGFGGLADPVFPLCQGVLSHLDALIQAALFALVSFPPLFAGPEGLANVLQGVLGQGGFAPGGQPLAEVLPDLAHGAFVDFLRRPGFLQRLDCGGLVVGRFLGGELRRLGVVPERFPVLSQRCQLLFSGLPPGHGVLGAAQGCVLLVPPEFGVGFRALFGDVFSSRFPDAAEVDLRRGDVFSGLFLVFGVPLQIVLHGAPLFHEVGMVFVELLEFLLVSGEVVVRIFRGGKLAPGEGVFPGAAQGAGFAVSQRLPLVFQSLDAQEQLPLGLQKFGLPGQGLQAPFGASPIVLQGALPLGEFLGALLGRFQQELVSFPKLEGMEPLVEEVSAVPQKVQVFPPFPQGTPFEELLQTFFLVGHGLFQDFEGFLPLLEALVLALEFFGGVVVAVFRFRHFLAPTGALAIEVLEGVQPFEEGSQGFHQGAIGGAPFQLGAEVFPSPALLLKQTFFFRPVFLEGFPVLFLPFPLRFLGAQGLCLFLELEVALSDALPQGAEVGLRGFEVLEGGFGRLPCLFRPAQGFVEVGETFLDLFQKAPLLVPTFSEEFQRSVETRQFQRPEGPGQAVFLRGEGFGLFCPFLE